MKCIDKKIGIVTVLYNSEAVLEDFFRTLSEQTYNNFVLYLVDNNSSDLSVKKAQEYAKNVYFKCKWLLQKENLGVAEGNNIGIKAALADGCDYILLSNNDVVLRKDSIEKLVEGMLLMKASMATSKIYYWDDPQKLWMAGGGFLWLQFTTYHCGYGEQDKGQYDVKKFTEYSPTCFMLIEKSVFSRVGFMDSAYFVYYDDTDFIWRSLKLGKEKLVYIPESVLWHKVSSCTGGVKSDFSMRYLERNRLLFALKYGNTFHLLIFFLYLIAHFFLRKLFVYSWHQNKLILQSYIEGWRVYKKSING